MYKHLMQQKVQQKLQQKVESAKLRATRLSWPTCGVLYVLSCLTCLEPYVILRSSSLTCFKFFKSNALIRISCIIVFMSCASSAYYYYYYCHYYNYHYYYYYCYYYCCYYYLYLQFVQRNKITNKNHLPSQSSIRVPY